ncbi:MAG: MBL fold metallo-hydrolase [Thaumarchaeota archaeon]|nr:MBL fold metallo-hydrolase [Nitrososphaerota archaeon]
MLLVRQIPVGPMANFVYVLVDEESRESMVIDSGWEKDPVLNAVHELRADVKYAVATHEHFDHTATLRELAGALGAKLVAHQASPIASDLRVGDNDELSLGRKKVKVLHTPGHTEDSVCLFDGKNVFTGDALFVGTIGRFVRADAEAMYRSLYEVLMRLPEGTLVYPGHDYGEVKFRTLGEEKAANPFLKAGDARAFTSLFS